MYKLQLRCGLNAILALINYIMKQTLISLLLALTSLCVSAQYFEGKVTYQNTYKSKSAAIKDEQLNTMMGTRQDYYIKGGDYKSETNGSFLLWQLYINKDNKLYSKLANSQAVLWNDGAANPDTVLSSELHKASTKILGYVCDELVLTCKSGVQKYYFNAGLPVDAGLYARHQFGNYYAYLQKAHAVPLKMIVDNAQFVMESTATEVKPMKLSPGLFMLPEGTQTAKSPY